MKDTGQGPGVRLMKRYPTAETGEMQTQIGEYRYLVIDGYTKVAIEESSLTSPA